MRKNNFNWIRTSSGMKLSDNLTDSLSFIGEIYPIVTLAHIQLIKKVVSLNLEHRQVYVESLGYNSPVLLNVDSTPMP